MIDNIREFVLSRAEVDYLRRLGSGAEQVAKLLRFRERGGPGRCVIGLSRAEAGALREYLMDRMDNVGFDEDYRPNPEGQMLEALIDKFFVP